MEQEPIEPLRKLLHEQGKVADKIFSIESALNSIRDNLSAAVSKQGPSNARPQDDMGKTLTKEEPTYERLLWALEDMKAQIEERVRPVAEQVVQAEVERLRDLSEHQKNALEECLTQIDQSILGCRNHVNTYREKRSDLVMLNQRLAKLGAEPVPIPEEIPAADFEDVIRARVEGLHTEGKI
jgi:predicted  nucleic acid-binding Zn-ribbon protein